MPAFSGMTATPTGKGSKPDRPACCMDESRNSTRMAEAAARLDAVAEVPVARPLRLPDTPHQRAVAHDMLLRESSRLSTWIDIGALVGMLMLFSLSFELALWKFATAPIGGDPQALEFVKSAIARDLLIPTLVVRAIIVMLLLRVVIGRRRQTSASIGLERSRLGANVLLGVATTGVAALLSGVTMMSLYWFWPGLWHQMQENAERIMTLVPRLHPIRAALVAITVGVYEELLFRGFLMTRLRRGLGSWTASVVVSTAVFTSLHGMDQTSAALVLITVLSLVFSAVTIWRRSIVPAIVAHTLWDFSQFVYLYYVAGDQWT